MTERDIFLAALDIACPTDRAAYVAVACADNPALRERLEAMLAFHNREDSFLDDSCVATHSWPPDTTIEGEGSIIGRYKLLEKIGEGGFAIVFMAEQTEPVRRRVALKVIKPGMDSKQIIGRFEIERQALALMDHPNIAKVFDGGMTDSGRPYFVMELVNGVPLTEYCDTFKLDTNERLAIFVQICRAVQHAHQKGIIHRDLKPSNVLVTLHDDAPVPKVIDFGIAKATQQRLTERTVFTRFQHFIGTPIYMSPEQATFSGLDIDTRSDIYSLGVLLYELLTGVTPFDKDKLSEAAYDELCRIIRDEQPPTPSTRISTLGEKLKLVAANRRTAPGELQHALCGELDWIVMKALEKDRSRRYETANAFAMDVERYLANEPVLACPPSAAYRLRKFALRNKAAVLTGALVFVALLGGTIGTSWQWFRAEDNAAAAKANEQTADVKRREAEKNLKRALAAEKGLKEQLWQSFVDQGRARIYSGQPGQRHKALEALREAAQIRGSPELRDLAIAALARTDIRLGHQWAGWPDGSDFVAFDADLEWYARADHNGTVSIRRVDDDQELFSLSDAAYKNMRFFLRFSSDQKYLAVTYGDGFEPQCTLHVWDLERRDKPVLKHPVCNRGFDFTPDSRQVAVAQSDGSIGLFDLRRGALVRPLGKGPMPNDLLISPDGTKLAVSAAFGSQVQVRDLASGALEATVECPGKMAHDLAWHPHDPNLLATANWGVHLWDLRIPEKPIATLPGQAGPTTNIAFSHSGDVLASKGWGDTTVRLWDTWTGRQLVQIPGTSAHGEEPLQFSRDDRRLAFYQSVTQIGWWDVELAREFRSLASHAQLHQGNYPSLDISPDGRLVVAPSRDGNSNGIRLWDLETGRELAFLPVGATFALKFHPQGGSLFSAHSEGLYQWPIRDGPDALHIGPPRRVGPHDTAVHVAFGPDGLRLAVAYINRGGMVLDLATPPPPPSAGSPQSVPSPDRLLSRMNNVERGVSFVQGPVNQVTLSSDGRWLAGAMSQSNGVMVFDLQSGKHLTTLPARLYSRAELSPDPDVKWLVTSAADEYCIYEVGTWERRHRLPRTAGGDGGGPIAFSPDGKVLAVVLDGLTVQLIDPATAHVFCTLEPPEPDRNLPGTLRFSPDGSQLAVCTPELRMLHVWDLRLLGDRLASLGQHWALPAFPAAPPQVGAAPRAVEVDYGELHRQVELADPLIQRYWDLMRTGGYAEAIAQLGKLLGRAPNHRLALNNLAWELATSPDEKQRDPTRAVELAKKAVERAPLDAIYWNTLGVAHYRAGDYRGAIEALAKSEELEPETHFAFNAFFLAMAHWQLEQTDEARQWLDRASAWMTRKEAELQNDASWQEELRRFRSEAENLIGVAPTKP
jgi:serine/threonine protein kinase/WD40 repeat protein